MGGLVCRIFCVLRFGGRFFTCLGRMLNIIPDVIPLGTRIMVFAVSILYLLFLAVMPHFSRRL